MTKSKHLDIELLGMSDIAQVLGVSYHTVRAWVITDEFPPPDWVVGKTYIWAEETVRAWIKDHPVRSPATYQRKFSASPKVRTPWAVGARAYLGG